MLTRGGLSRPINVEGSAVDPDAVCWIVRVGEHVKDARDISRLLMASVRGTGGKQAAETYVGDVVAALDRAGVALIGVVTADMHVTFHARAGGDSDGNGEQSRDAGEHGRSEEGGLRLRLESIWASEEAYLCCRWWLGSERK